MAAVSAGGAAASGSRKEPRAGSPFLVKTFNLLEEGHYSDLVRWNDAGDAIVVTDPDRFAKEVLPLFFKHNNWHSFVRQLHIYGFRKTGDSTVTMFRHPLFVRGGRSKLNAIKRKVVAPTGSTPSSGGGGAPSSRDSASSSGGGRTPTKSSSMPPVMPPAAGGAAAPVPMSGHSLAAFHHAPHAAQIHHSNAMAAVAATAAAHRNKNNANPNRRRLAAAAAAAAAALSPKPPPAHASVVSASAIGPATPGLPTPIMPIPPGSQQLIHIVNELNHLSAVSGALSASAAAASLTPGMLSTLSLGMSPPMMFPDTPHADQGDTPLSPRMIHEPASDELNVLLQRQSALHDRIALLHQRITTLNETVLKWMMMMQTGRPGVFAQVPLRPKADSLSCPPDDDFFSSNMPFGTPSML